MAGTQNDTDPLEGMQNITTPCKTLGDSGYNLREGVDRKKFETARGIEIEMMKAVFDAMGPEIFKITDPQYQDMRRPLEPSDKRDKIYHVESYDKLRGHIRKRTIPPKDRDEQFKLMLSALTLAYDRAGIPELVKEYRLDKEVIPADTLARQTLDAMCSYVQYKMEKGTGSHFPTAG